jgi:hypothetical protein
VTRNDVIDVLTAVAAADRRTVGEADVDVWQAIIGDLPRDLALKAVRDHLRDQPGVWLEPGHIHQRVRAHVRDQLEREPDEYREARQDALAAKVAEAVTAIAEAKASFPQKITRPKVNALTVPCPYCKAGIGRLCTNDAMGGKPRTPHPSRIEAL